MERAANGDILWDGVIIDTTERRGAEEEAKRAAQRVQTVLESITDAFYSLDREWRFTYVNEQAQRVLERPRGELLGRSFWEVFPTRRRWPTTRSSTGRWNRPACRLRVVLRTAQEMARRACLPVRRRPFRVRAEHHRAQAGAEGAGE